MKITYNKKSDKLIILLNNNQQDNAIEKTNNFTIHLDNEEKPVMIEINNASQVVDFQSIGISIPVEKIEITRG